MGISAAWSDRFTVPTADGLRKAMAKPFADLVETARSRLQELGTLSEEVSWEGVSWRWTLVYHAEGAQKGRPWAYLIPNPDGPKLAIPFDEAELRRLPLARAKKHVRDGIMSAKRVDKTLWAVWDVNSKAALDDVFDLVKRRHKLSHETN